MSKKEYLQPTEGAKMDADQEKDFLEKKEWYDTIVIGGGQAGLAAGYFLKRVGDDFIILEKNPRTGDSWRSRWDSLRLFTPSQMNGLPGKPYPSPVNYFPAKNEVADYLEGYASQFNLPIMHGMEVETLSRNSNGYEVTTSKSRFHAKNVIVASGPFQSASSPAFASELDPAIFQLHSSAYRNPQQVPADSVLVVGAGNSGAEIALELVKAGRQVWLAGRDVGHVPANSPLGRAFNGRPMWWFMSHVLSVNTPIGRKMRPGMLQHGTPLGRAQRQEIEQAGVELTPRVKGIKSGKPEIEGGRLLPVDGVIWATGLRPDYRWIHLPIFDEHGFPRHWRGVVQEAPGLYFVGLVFQTALSSSLLGGVGADAGYIVNQIGRHTNAAAADPRAARADSQPRGSRA
jgi:putative flavoprotein involved in K+ transport